VFVSVLIAALSPELVLLISGPDYLAASTMLPGLVAAAAMAGGFYVLLVAAGVSRRGTAVGVAAIAGAVTQVIATALLLPAFGLPAVGAAAALGQGLALVVLGAVVASRVHGGVAAVIAMCAGGAMVVALQAVNAAPESTQLLRLSIAVISAAVCGFALIRLVNGERATRPPNPA
jgi:hypothetical protein